MRAVVYEAPRVFSIKEVSTPEAGAGEIRIKVIQTGVCGTDLHLHEGQFMATFPFIPGHETVGIVDQLGLGVTGFSLGEQVTVNPNSSCGTCSFCRAGRRLLCPEIKGMGSNMPGAFAEYLVAPSAQVFSVEGMDPDVAVFTEPTSCVMHGVDVLDPRPGSSALVIGAGPTGLLLAQVIASSGSSHVTVAARTQFKLDLATKFGIDSTYKMNPQDLSGDIKALYAMTGGEGFDIVVDATGDVNVCQSLFELVRFGGTVLLYGVGDENDRVSISPYEIFRRELTIKGSFAEIESFPAAVSVLRSGRAQTNGIITHRFKLEEYQKALDVQRTDPSRHKIVIIP